MIRFLSTRAVTAVVAFGLLVAVPSHPVEAGPSIHKADKATKKAQKQFNKQARSHIRFMRSQLNNFLKDYCQDVDEVAAGVEAGSINGFDAIFTLQLANSVAFGAAVGLALSPVLSSGIADANQAYSSIPDAGSKVTGFRIGECGPMDDFIDDVGIELQRFRDRLNKKQKKILKAMNKKKKIVANGQMGAIAPPMPAPPVAAPMPPPPKEFTIDSKASGATVSQPNSGILCIGGQADPNTTAGIDVVVKNEAGQEVDSVTVPIGPDCRWRACFPMGSPGTLPSGNYRIEAKRTEDVNGLSADFSVPATGAPITSK